MTGRALRILAGVWLKIAKKPETWAARIEKFVAMLARHEKVHP